MTDTKTTPWKMTASALIWGLVAIWILISIVQSALGGILGALTFGALASMLVAGYSTSDIRKL